MDGKEHRLLKERMTAVEVKVEQELGIGPKVHESRSLCDAFILFSDYTEYFSLSFLFWDTEPAGKKVVMCGRIRDWFCF